MAGDAPQQSVEERIRLDLAARARLRRLFISKISKEGFVFLPLLVLVTLFVVLTHSPSQAALSESMQRRFESRYGTSIDSPPLRRVSNTEQVYNWLEQQAIPNLISSSTFDSATGRYYVNSVNILLGGIRFLQKRVPKESCTTKDLVLDSSGPWECYPSLKVGGEETATWTALSNASWQPYQTCAQLGGCLFLEPEKLHSPYSELDYSYQGYKIDVGLDAATVGDVVTTMRADNWIDKQTRLVLLQFTTYNAAANLHTSAEIFFEFLPGGEVKPSSRFATQRLLGSFGDLQQLLVPVELGIYALVLANLVFHSYNLIRLGFVGWLKLNGVVSDPNRRGSGTQVLFELFDYINLIIAVVSLSQFIQWNLNQHVQDLDVQASASTFVNYVPYIKHREVQVSLWGVNVLVMVFKCFKYLQISNSLNTLWRTLASTSGELLLFLLIMGSLMSGFALTGMILFGNGNRAWYSYAAALSTLARIILKQSCAPGEVCVPLAEEFPLVGLVFSVLFTLAIYLVMLAMFLVLMSNAYLVVQDEEFRQILLSEARAPAAGTLDEITSAAWRRLKKTARLWYSMCALCDFSELNTGTLPDSLEALEDEELSSGEDEAVAELERLTMSAEEREAIEAQERAAAMAVAEEGAAAERRSEQEWKFIDKHAGHQATGNLLEQASDDDEEPAEGEELERAGTGRGSSVEDPGIRAKLEAEWEYLEDQCSQYSELDSQLAPEWLAERFRALSTTAKKAGLVLIEQKALAQYSMLRQQQCRSSRQSRLFNILNPN